MRLIWLSDCHFHLNNPYMKRPFQQYVARVAAESPDGLLLGGDLCDCRSLDRLLGAFRKRLAVPIYFVLGNHEFRDSNIAQVRLLAAEYSRRFSQVHWLSAMSEPIRLTCGTALIGHDCWGDGRAGDLSARNLRRRIHQFLYDEIIDIRNIRAEAGNDTAGFANAILPFMNRMGDEAAEHLGRLGRMAAHWARRVIVLTHVPLWPEVTLHGRNDAPEPKGLPFFCCVAAGEAVRRLAEEFPCVKFIVLSGHTHRATRAMILPNLQAWVHDPEFKDVESRWAVIEL